MKRRVLSGLLAAVLLFTTAFAAGADPVPEEETQPAVLTYAVALPEGADDSRMDDETMERVRAVLERRLAQLDLAQAEVSFSDDRAAVTVTLPVDAPDEGVAEFLALQGRLSFTDADGKAWLTGADVSAAEAGLSASAEGEEAQTAYILLTLTDEGRQAYAEAQAALDATRGEKDA